MDFSSADPNPFCNSGELPFTESGNFRQLFGESEKNEPVGSFPVPATSIGAAKTDLSPGNGGLTNTDPQVPLFNLSILQLKMDRLHQFLSGSMHQNASISSEQQEMVSSEIVSAIQGIIVNGAALLSSCQQQNPRTNIGEGSIQIAGKILDPVKVPTSSSLAGKLPDPNVPSRCLIAGEVQDPVVPTSSQTAGKVPGPVNLPAATSGEGKNGDGYSLVELDAVELLAEHVHFCEICGKGFKRDANLRMHMRAHGNQYKTPEALVKPRNNNSAGCAAGKIRFSCPFSGCNRNKGHKKFRPLKSVICVKNHFRRSHCPKMFSCNKCNKKSFSVVADLKSHLKNCGECKWQCCCGTSFSRKDKLLGHMALFDGHMPASVPDCEESKGLVSKSGEGIDDDGSFDFDADLMDDFETMEESCFENIGDDLFAFDGRRLGFPFHGLGSAGESF